MPVIQGATGADILIGGAGADQLFGQDGNDVLQGLAGGDGLVGGTGSDNLQGGDGDDLIITGVGVAGQLAGGSTLFVLAPTVNAPDVVDGGNGNDIVGIDASADTAGYSIDISNPSAVNVVFRDGVAFGSLTNVEGVVFNGGSGNDVITSGNLDSTLSGGAGNDTLIGGLGRGQTLDGGSGDDILIGGGGSDVLRGGTGSDTAVFSGLRSAYSIADPVGASSGSVHGPGGTVTLFGIEFLQFDDQTIDLRGTVGSSGPDTLTSASVSSSSLYGMAGDDILTGLSGPDLIEGGDGADNINGGAGDDTIGGGAGNDTINGGLGNDTIDGGDGNDLLTGGGGTDTINGEGGDDTIVGDGTLSGGIGNDTLTDAAGGVLATLIGGPGDDTLIGDGALTVASYATATAAVVVDLRLASAQNTGAQGSDTLSNVPNLTGSAYDDVLTGNDGPNILVGGIGNDHLSGQGGDDVLQGGYGNDILDGGAGSDTASYADIVSGFGPGVTVDLRLQGVAQNTGDAGGVDTLISIENVTGSGSNDQLTGDAGPNTLIGGNGDDILDGGPGDDVLQGGSGTDVVSYADATSAVTVDLTLTTAQNTGGAGVDTLSGVEGVVGSSFNDVLTGANTSDSLSGFVFTITGGAGDDLLQGNPGANTLDGGSGSDTVSYALSASAVTVSLAITGAQTAGSDRDTLISIENLTGSAFGDTLTGDGGANHLVGGSGDDTLVGAGGDDLLDGGAGNDTASYAVASGGVNVSLVVSGPQDTGGAGTDTLIGIENVTGTIYADNLVGNDTSNVLIGGGGADVLSGAGGDDTLDGGPGDDSLDGGAGNDTASYASSAAAVTVNLGTTGPQDTTGAGVDTLVNIENLTGSSAADTLTGNASDNVLHGGIGNDILDGGAGNDTLDGGDGGDTASYLSATAGVTVNLAVAGPQNTGGAGVDTLISIENLVGSNFNDVLSGNNASNDILDGGAGIDTISYANATAAVFGGLGPGDGSVSGTGIGVDTLRNFENITGSAFDDVLSGNHGDNVIDGGAGSDMVDYSNAVTGVTISLLLQGVAQQTGGEGMDTLISVENLRGSSFNDLLIGDAGDNHLIGNGGDDTLIGGLGNNVLDGFGGVDTDSYATASGGVTVSVALTTAQNTGGAGIDTLVSIENLTGSAFNDFLTGDANANVLDGGLGDDTLNGAGGLDTASYASAGSAVTVNLALTSAQNTLGAGVDTLVSIENLTGSAFNDTLTGDANANVLEGGGGNDSLDGAGGSDTASYTTATGGVTVSLALAGPQNTVGAGTDTLANIENLSGSNFDDVLRGDGSNNILSGGAGNDTLDGGAGNDTLDGGAGTNLATYALAPSAVTVNLSLSTSQNTGGGGSDTLINIESLTGSAFDDLFIAGGGGAGVLDGGSGSDTVSYSASFKSVNASLAIVGPQDTGWGIDTFLNIENLTGSAQDDTLEGNSGNNVLNGAAGSNTASYLNAASGVTVSLLLAGSAQQTIGAGSDTLVSFENLIGSAFNDTLTGDASANVLQGGGGNDTLDGGGGLDTASYALAASGVTVSLAIAGAQNTTGAGTDSLVNIENLTGSGFNDTLTANGSGSALSGGAGDDLLVGGSGTDAFDGGVGVDTVSYALAASAVTVSLLGPSPHSSGGGGSDTFANIENLVGSDFNDDLTAGTSGTLWGGAGDDILRTGNGSTITMDGGPGNDTLLGGGGDIATYADATSGVTVNLTLTGPQNTVGAGIDTLSRISSLIGSSFNDTLVGNGLSVSGGAGDDVLSGSATLFSGGDGNDLIIPLNVGHYDGGAGFDTVQFTSFGNTVGHVFDMTQTGSTSFVSIEQIIGSDFNDIMIGDAGDTIFKGGLGDDDINGGPGSDTALFSGPRSDYVITPTGAAFIVTGPEGLDTLTNIEFAQFADQTVQLVQAPSTINDTDLGNVVIGTNGDDTINGFAGDDDLRGLDGNDILDGGAGNDRLDGGPGMDTVSYASSANFAVVVSLATTEPQVTGEGTDVLLNIENLVGSPFDDTLIGNGGDNILNGGGGSDTVSYALAAGGVHISLVTAGPQDTGGAGTDTLISIESLIGSAFNDVLTGNAGDNVLSGGAGDDIIEGGLGDDTIDGGDGVDTVSYASAPGGVTVDLRLTFGPNFSSGPNITGSAGVDNIANVENLTGSAFDDTLTGNAGDNVLKGGDGVDHITGDAGNDTIDGGGNVDTAVFSGAMSAYIITHLGDTATVTGPDGTDTLTNVEYFQFSDQTIHFLPGVGTAVNFSADPSTFMGAIRDFDGNDLGDASGWQKIGTVDIQGDGTPEQIFVNSENGRWASVGTGPDGLVYFDDHGWAGDTRVVGIYIDPLVQSGEVVQGSDFDSQRRFQNDLFINNIHGILGAGDYDHNGLQEVYFSLTDGTAYLHAYMHADGNIEYANYQSEAQVISYLTSEGFGPSTWAGWFPDGGHQTGDLIQL